MCSYNSVNGTPACANSYFMQTILRDHWNWTEYHQYITSDCDDVYDIYTTHYYVNTSAQAAGLAYTAGIDTACSITEHTNVTGAYNEGLLSNATITRSLKRQYEALVRAGYFDTNNSTLYRTLNWGDVGTAASQQLARRAASEGIVMSKNDGYLPVSLANCSVAMVGYGVNASQSQQLGAYSGVPPYLHTPQYAAQQLGVNVNFAYAPVSVANSSVPDTWTAGALDAVSKSDVVIYIGGNDGTIEGEQLDRTSIAWESVQFDLIEKICALGKPCIVVQFGDQNDETPLLHNANVPFSGPLIRAKTVGRPCSMSSPVPWLQLEGCWSRNTRRHMLTKYL